MTGLDRLIAAFGSYITQGHTYTLALTFAVQHSARSGDGPYKILRHALPAGSQFTTGQIETAMLVSRV